MISQPKISIIIPSFNKAKYISSTIDSILSQEYEKYDIYIQDGGSTDDTKAIVQKYIKEYPNKIYFESKRDNGQCDAINTAINKSKGDIVTFLNADDVYFGHQVFKKVAFKYLSHPKSMWFAGKGIVINDNGVENSSLIYRLFVKYFKFLLLKINKYLILLIVNYLHQPSVFITKKAYKIYGPFIGNRNFVSEYDMWLKLGKVKMPEIIDDVISGFRLAQGSITLNKHYKLLSYDQKVVNKYTKNKLLLFIHALINLGRCFVVKIL